MSYLYSWNMTHSFQCKLVLIRKRKRTFETKKMLSDVINYLQTHLPFGTSFLFINGVCFKMFLPVYRLILLVKRKFFSACDVFHQKFKWVLPVFLLLHIGFQHHHIGALCRERETCNCTNSSNRRFLQGSAVQQNMWLHHFVLFEDQQYVAPWTSPPPPLSLCKPVTAKIKLSSIDPQIGRLTWVWGSVNPGDWNPLWGGADLFQSSLQDPEHQPSLSLSIPFRSFYSCSFFYYCSFAEILRTHRGTHSPT